LTLLLLLEFVSNILTIVLTYFFYKLHCISETQVDRSACPVQQFITWVLCAVSIGGGEFRKCAGGADDRRWNSKCIVL